MVYAKKYSKNDSQAPWIVVVIEGNAWGNWEQREVKQVIFIFRTSSAAALRFGFPFLVRLLFLFLATKRPNS